MKPKQITETGCCKRFDPRPWQDKRLVWKDKLFLKDRVLSLFHIPLNMGKVIVRDLEKINSAGASAKEQLMLFDENSLFGADIYIYVSKPVPGAELARISGTFLSKVFEGNFSQMGKWIKEMNGFVSSKKAKASKMYFFYTTCPACAKAYGKNYAVILAKVD